MPDGLPVGAYKDPGCTQPLGYSYKGSCATAPQPKYGMVTGPYDPATCVGGVSLRPVVAKLGAQSVYLGDPASCSEITAAEWMPNYDAYDLGPEISPTEFVAGDYVVE